MNNRNILLPVGIIILSCLVLLMATEPNEESPHLVVASWGGSFQDAQRQVLFKPFTLETGIEILEITGPSMARIKAMVDSGRSDWDVALMTPADVLTLADAGYLAEIAYDDNYFNNTLENIDERAISVHGIADFFSSKVISYNTGFYTEDHHPGTWEEFWDADQYPGLRIIDAGDWSVPPIEYALLADGVSPDNLYPLDLERAYRSIEKIQPHVLKFSTSPVMPAQGLVDGEVALAAVTLGRIAQLKQQGAPVDFEWNQGLMEVNYWVIVGNTKNYDAAMEFIKFTTHPDIQAAMAKLQPLGPTNKQAFDYLSNERAKELPTYPDNLEKQIFVSAEFWAKKDTSGKTNTEKNAELWRRFSLTR